MEYFVRIKQPAHIPQACGVWAETGYFCPVFLHAAANQDRPVGSKSTFHPHTHNFYHLVLYTKGPGFYHLQDTYQPAGPGTCVLISPGQEHEFITQRGSSVYSEITFAYENDRREALQLSFEQILSHYSGVSVTLPSPIELDTESQQQLQNYLIQIVDYLNSHREQSLYQAHRCLASIFHFLISRSLSQPVPSLIDDRLQQVRLWIEAHYQDPLDMEELARMAGISRGYFFRSFHKVFDISPLAYQQQLRIEAAKTLLRAASLNGSEIARRTGFENDCFFYRVFKKHVGMTPKQYRRALGH